MIFQEEIKKIKRKTFLGAMKNIKDYCDKNNVDYETLEMEWLKAVE